MIYDYKSANRVQDIIFGNLSDIVDDVIDEFENLPYEDALYIFAPADIALKIFSSVIKYDDDFNEDPYLYVHDEADVQLLHSDKDVLISISGDGEIYVETARGLGGHFKDMEGTSSICYVYDGYTMKEVDDLESEDHILIFGFEEKCCDKGIKPDKCDCEIKCKKINSKEFAESYKAFNELEDEYLDNIKNMLLRYSSLMDKVNDMMVKY